MLARLLRLLRRGDRGLEALEVLLVAPIFVTVLVVVINGGFAVFANQLVQEAARNACRQGVVSVNPAQAAEDAAQQYIAMLPGDDKSVYVGVGADFLYCRVEYRVPSLSPLFPSVVTRGVAKFRMEGW